MFESYYEAVRFLYNSLPMFQRVGAAALKHDLTNTKRLCSVLDNPQNKFKAIHIAGTNGKGSSSHMIASVLQEAGYRTGLFTSPHLKEFTERIRINGKSVARDYVRDFVNRIKPAIDEIKPSFFEMNAAMAFDYFAMMEVETAVIETGLGGRLDSTNVITPLVSLITNIGWDHKEILGDTLEKIAAEKAGIIKSDVPVVISERQEETHKVFEQTAAAKHSPIVFASDLYCVRRHVTPDRHALVVRKGGELVFDSLDLPLLGYYQEKNLCGVLATLDALRDCGLSISNQNIRLGLQNVVANTHLMGRWQILSDSPLVVCDTAHNVDGIRQVVNQIRDQPYDKLHIVIGMVRDKDFRSVLAEFPKDAYYYFCEARIPRALPAAELKAAAAGTGLRGEVIPDVNEAIHRATQNADAGDFIFIGGSTFVVGEIDNL